LTRAPAARSDGWHLRPPGPIFVYLRAAPQWTSSGSLSARCWRTRSLRDGYTIATFEAATRG